MKFKIEKYTAAWHPGQDKGHIRLELENGQIKTWTGDAFEFCAQLSILQGENIAFLNNG